MTFKSEPLRRRYEDLINILDATGSRFNSLDRKLEQLEREITETEKLAMRVCDIDPPSPCGQCGHVYLHRPFCPLENNGNHRRTERVGRANG